MNDFTLKLVVYLAVVVFITIGAEIIEYFIGGSIRFFYFGAMCVALWHSLNVYDGKKYSIRETLLRTRGSERR